MTPADRDLCGVCGGAEFEALHSQGFLLPGERKTTYLVAACRACGFAFARDIPSPEDYEAYYESNRKYTYEGSNNVSSGLKAIHGDSFGMVDGYLAVHSPPFAGKETRIADIGCSTGALLSLFKSAGYRQLVGVDPAPECRDIGARLYGVEIETGPLSRHRPLRPYEVILFSSVLEHLPNPLESIEQASQILAPGGLLFVQVPDADNFGEQLKEPFLEFSIEHVNYFTITSLTNLMARAGFGPIRQRHDVLMYSGTAYPALTSLWQRDESARERPPARSDLAPLRTYIDRCLQKLESIEAAIDGLIATGQEVVIWGVGSLTSRLLATTRLSEANISRFVDSNTSMHGKTVAGREIVSPAILQSGNGTVFIASYVYGEEIRRTLLEEMNFRGTVISI